MLGYVKTYKPELKIKDYEAYRGIYCTVCRYLGKSYGLVSRLLLSYDVTFLALVLISASSRKAEFKPGRCPFNAAKKCNYCQSHQEILSFSAAVTVLLFYHRVRDNISDCGSLKRILMYLILPYASLKRKKAAKKYERLDLLLSDCMAEQARVETEKTASFDKAADPSAKALGKIFTYFNSDNPALYTFGYAVGRWVYLIDAADDLEQDLRQSSFNVIINRYNLKRALEYDGEKRRQLIESLNMTRAQAYQALEQLGLTLFRDIIENILVEGMEQSMNKAFERKMNDEGSV